MHRAYSLSHYVCPPDIDLLSFLDMAVHHGFASVGLTERALGEVPAQRLKTELAARGLGVTSVNSAGHFLDRDADAIAKQRRRNQWLVDSAAELGAAPLNVYTGGLGAARGSLTLAEARARSAAEVASLNEATRAANVAMVFEPIHPSAIWVRSVFNTIAQSEALTAGLSGCAINLDFYHSWWDADFNTFIERADSPIGLVQISDVSHAAGDGVGRRVPLGEGDLDIHGLLKACLARPVPPPIEVELFAFQLEDRALQDTLASTVRYLAAFEDTL